MRRGAEATSWGRSIARLSISFYPQGMIEPKTQFGLEEIFAVFGEDGSKQA
jgi:hypothetical protein